MDSVVIKSPQTIGRGFIFGADVPAGQDEYYLRNMQHNGPGRTWRNLHAAEVECLIKNGNNSDNWGQVLVSEEFDPGQIKNTEFYGLVRIGRLRNVVLEHHELELPTGITNSVILACDIGDDVAIHGVRYLAHYIIGDRCILFNINEMNTTNHAKFGNGIIKDDEPESVRVWLDLMNETGGRRVLPFDGMISADAYLWAKYRDDAALQEQLKAMTQSRFDSRRGYYGTIGRQCVIKNSRILKDVKIGEYCYIKGANKLKNLTINSSQQEPGQIGEGVELVNGIVGYGCHIFYGCKAVRFILGNNSNLKYGARLINSFLGDNSTISCCEVLNNLIFPAHEQHHNNSFLIASVVQGQSNMAAGATVGSNHNSRANDNEIQAGRGFWPGLCTSVKHSSRFASFTLLAKGDYPAELDIPLPFSLLNNNVAADCLEVMPAFWWLFNMFALARNSWKFQSRDKRVCKTQHIEFDTLAPDTAEELIAGRRLLEEWTGKALLKQSGKTAAGLSAEQLRQMGRQWLVLAGKGDDLEVLGQGMEKSRRKVLIIKPRDAWRAYGDMLVYYAVKNSFAYLQANPGANFDAMSKALAGGQREWTNLGGQLIATAEVDRLRADAGSGKLDSWDAIHRRYDELWAAYPLEKQKHAFAVLCDLYGGSLSGSQWHEAVEQSIRIQEYVRDQVYLSRKKDYDNPFRRATFRNEQEMNATVGTIDDNSFVSQVRDETEGFKKTADEMIRRN